MTILVDVAVWRWRGRRWAHLASDDSYEELHDFAAQLGLARAWFQGDHYDVPSDVREQALRLGATPVDSRELLLRLCEAGLRRPRSLRRVDGRSLPVDRSSLNPWLHDPTVRRGEAYQRILDQRAAVSANPHGEADVVSELLADRPGARVLDAGCGTGRVGIELARRGFEVVGVDLDPDNLAVARRLHPEVQWREADLATLDLPGRFDLAVAAGNVLCFLTPGTHRAAVTALAAHLEPGGLLVAGFQLGRGTISTARYDRLCARAGLDLVQRTGGWHGEPPSADYQVSVHRRGLSEP